VWVFQNNDKLIPGVDYTATNGTSITLTNASGSSTDQYEVVSFTPFAVNGMLPLAGGTMTGALVVNSSITSTSTYMNAAAGVARINTYETSGVTRWVEGVSSDAETGSNAGSNWYLARSSDAGAWIDNPLFVSRQSGLVSLSQGLIMPDGYTVQNTGMGRNRIINGDCRVAQRASVAVASGTGTYGGPDRFWCGQIAGGQFTQSAGTLVYNGVTKNCVTQTVNTAWSTWTTTNYWSGFNQRIEGFNCYDMLGSPAALSFIFKASVAGLYSVAIEDSTQTNSFVSSFTVAAGVATKIIIPVASLPTSLVTAANNGIGLMVWIGALNAATYTSTSGNLNTWQSGNIFVAPGVVNWAATAGNTISMTDLQFESGLNATPFERLSVGTLVSLCQRYYEVLSGGNYGVGGMNGTTTAYVFVPWQTTKRASPTITYTAASTFYCWSATAGNAVPSALGVNTASTRQALFQVTVSGATAGQATLLEDQSGSAIYINSEI
jgi:hypothetical protein